MNYNKDLYNIPQYGLGGFLKKNAAAVGTVAGVGLGALGTFLLPGAGTAAGYSLGASIGASLGGAVGGAVESNAAEADALDAQRQADAQALQASRKSLYKPLSASQMYGVYKLGGELGTDVPNPIINIEAGELAVKKPQEGSRAGKIVKEFTGVNPLTNSKYEPHAKDSKKEPVGNYVPRQMIKGDLEADYIISNKYAKEYKDATRRRDKFALNSIIRNIDAESQLGTDVRNKQMKMGGAIPKYSGGGGIDLRDPRQGFPLMLDNSPLFRNANEDLSGVPGYSPITRIAPQTSMQTMSMRQPDLGVTTPVLKGGSAQPDVYKTQSQGMDPLVGNAMLAAVPGLINLGRGLFEKPTKVDRVQPIYNPYEGVGLSKFSGRLSAYPALNEMRTQRNMGARGLANTTNNASVLRSNLQGLYSGTQKGSGSIITDTRRSNLGLDAQEGQAILGAGAQRQAANMQAQQSNLQIDEMNRANRAAKSNLTAAGLADIPKQMLQLSQNQDARSMDAFKTMMLMDTFGTSKDMYNQPKYQKFLRRLNLI